MGSYPIGHGTKSPYMYGSGPSTLKGSTIAIVVTVVIIFGLAIIFGTPAPTHVTLTSLIAKLQEYPVGKLMCEVGGEQVNVVGVASSGEIFVAEEVPNKGTFIKIAAIHNVSTDDIQCILP